MVVGVLSVETDLLIVVAVEGEGGDAARRHEAGQLVAVELAGHLEVGCQRSQAVVIQQLPHGDAVGLQMSGEDTVFGPLTSL